MYAHWMVSGKSPEEKGGGGQAHVTRHTSHPTLPASSHQPPSPEEPSLPSLPYWSLFPSSSFLLIGHCSQNAPALALLLGSPFL